MIKKFYWPAIKSDIQKIIEKCEVCQIANRKNSGTGIFVETSFPLKKVALDLIDIREEGKYILVWIDYFSRFMAARIL